jgi:hypothetical protein
VTRNLAFYQKKSSSVKQTDLRDMLKMACKSVCTATVISPDTLSHTPSTIKSPENTKEDPNDPDPADEGHFQIEHSFNEMRRPSIGAVTKN